MRADFLPQIYYRVVVRATEERPWRYLDPRSKSFTDANHARKYRDKARKTGLVANLYFTQTFWQELED